MTQTATIVNEASDYIGTATYSPEDNKLRITPFARLSAETYARVKAAGYGWAPKQGVFVAPMWTPARHDLALELCGEIGDEDTTLCERAEERAERFEGYQERRADDATRAAERVQELCDGIPFGQPILVGHHSERHARRVAKRIEQGTRYAVNMWETSEYWKRRAAGAVRLAKYKDKPEVRARRIKGLEADKRRQERTETDSAKIVALWEKDGLTHDRALQITNFFDHVSQCFPLADYPRNPPASQYEGVMSLWSALNGGVITAEQARDISLPRHRAVIAWAKRWNDHYTNRIAYERAMLDEQGASALLEKKPRTATRAALPLCNYMVADGLTIPSRYHRGQMDHYPMHVMTKAEYAKIHIDYKGTRIVGNSHRVRTAMVRLSGEPGDNGRGLKLCAVFLSDSKTHEPPAAVDPKPVKPVAAPRLHIVTTTEAHIQPDADAGAQFKAMRETLRNGSVQVVSANQLFPTPRDLAGRMARTLDVQPGHRVLEPSAGTGMLLGALGCRMFGHNPERGAVVAVEYNRALADRLIREFPLTNVYCADFLAWGQDVEPFDRIIMNPPFENGADIKHIQHAREMLKPGGLLVAICAAGPRQHAALEPIASYWEELPAGTFEGTNVRTVLLTIEGK